MFVKIYTIYYNNNINCLRSQAINMYNKEKECAPVRCQIYNWWESSLVKPSKLPVPSPWSTKG